MKRRNFLKKIPIALSLPFAINGIPLKVMANNPLSRLAQQGDSDRVLIILQLHGGNDGLNTLIPVDDYDLYYSRRANIAIPKSNSLRKYIPLDSTLPLNKQVGLHPDMQAMKGMYDQGKVAFVQGCFLQKQQWLTLVEETFGYGIGSDDYSSGWVGRYLKHEYAPLNTGRFSNDDMLDPLGIEMGTVCRSSSIRKQYSNIALRPLVLPTW